MFKNSVEIFFINPDGKKFRVEAAIGLTLLEVVKKHNGSNPDDLIQMEGACDGAMACSTCHIIVVNSDYFTSLDLASDDEENLLDHCYGLTKNSRLACQVIVDAKMKDQLFQMPKATRNILN